MSTCIDVDVDKSAKHKHQQKYTIKMGHRTKCFVPYRGKCREICKTQFLHYFSTPDPVNLQSHPGYVWLKSGYSESIPWRKVRLTKQGNVDLTTDGLWAVPLRTGWVPVKERRLQDWEKLKKYAPLHKQGNVCLNGVPALPEKGNSNDDDDSE